MALFGFLSSLPLPATADLVLDTFEVAGRSSFGTGWDGFTDRVMGGLTEMQARWGREDGVSFLSMEGRVRTENNGGFLQMRLGLERDGRALDARPWAGLRLVVRGQPGSYAVHLRTGQTWFPWQFFSQAFDVGPAWTEVRLPFTGFRGDYGARGEAELRTLKSVAVVAIGRAFDARLQVRELGLYAGRTP